MTAILGKNMGPTWSTLSGAHLYGACVYSQQAELPSTSDQRLLIPNLVQCQRSAARLNELDRDMRPFGGVLVHQLTAASSSDLSASSSSISGSNSAHGRNGDSPPRLNGWLPLSEVVAFMETVKTFQLNDIIARYDELACSGLTRELLDEVLKERFDVRPIKLEHDINHQTPNPQRSITELISNAVDATPRMNGVINVYLKDGSYVVRDRGKGMDATEVFERLLIPQLSGKEGRSTIGRFGVGFFTALTHLKHNGSRVMVDTKKKGGQAIRVVFTRLNDELCVRIGPSPKKEAGTRIEIRDPRIETPEFSKELNSHISYILGRRIIVNGTQINSFTSSSMTCVGDGKLYVSGESCTTGKVVITIGGVKIEEYSISGVDVPKLMVLEFPLITKLPESRNQIQIDDMARKQVKSFIDYVTELEGDKARIRYLNGIAPMIKALQKRNRSLDVDDNLVRYARKIAFENITIRNPFPSNRGFASLIDEKLTRLDNLYLSRGWHTKLAHPQEWKGPAMILADFKPDAKNALLYDTEHSLVILDRKLYHIHRSDPAGLRVLTDLLPQGVSGKWIWPDMNEPESDTGLSADMDATVKNVIKMHPVLSGQRDELGKLAEADPKALQLISKLQTAISYNPAKSGWVIQEVHRQLLDKNYLRVFGSLPKAKALEGAKKHVFKKDYLLMEDYGEGSDTIILAKHEDGMWKFFNFRDKWWSKEFRSIAHYGHDNHRFLVVENEDRLYSVIKCEDRFLDEGSFLSVEVDGKGEDAILLVRNRNGKMQAIRPDLSALFRGEFWEIVVKGEGEDRTFYGLNSNGDWQTFDNQGAPTFIDEDTLDDLKQENQPYVFPRYNDGRWYASRLDGKPVFEGTYRDMRVVGHGIDRVLLAQDDTGKWQAIRPDETPVFEGAYWDVRIYGEGEDRVYVVGERGDYRLLAASGDKLYEDTFKDVEIYRDKDSYFFLGFNDYGQFKMFRSLRVELLYADETREHIKANIKHIVESGASSEDQKKLLTAAFVYTHEQFMFVSNIAPYIKTNLLMFPEMIEEFMRVSERYPPDVLGAFFDLMQVFCLGKFQNSRDKRGVASQTVDKLEVIAQKSGVSSLINLNEAIFENTELVDIAFYNRINELGTFPPEMRGFAIYLMMDAAQLFIDSSPIAPSLQGEASLSLRDLNAAVRSDWSSWGNFSGSVEEAIQRINMRPVDPEIARNRIRHAMYHLGEPERHLFLRELIQNSIDAIRGNGDNGNIIDIESFLQDGAHVLRITDPVGMNFSEVVQNLLVIGESTKGKDNLGKFGVGFFTIFPGAKEVRIRTGKDEGQYVDLTMTPIYQGEEVVDVQVSYILREGDFKGTVIERVSGGNIAEYDAALISNSIFTYGRFIDTGEVTIRHNGNLINEKMIHRVERSVPGIGKLRLYEAKENAFTVGSLFVKYIPHHIIESIPPLIRDSALARGIVIDFPGGTSLVRARNDFIGADDIENKIASALPAMLLESYLLRFSRGETDLTGMPTDYFTKMVNSSYMSVPVDIRNDAQRLGQGYSLNDYSRYTDERSLFQLISLLPCLQIGNDTLSLRDILKLLSSDKEIDTSKFPAGIANLLKNRSRREKFQEQYRKSLVGISDELNVPTHIVMDRMWTHNEARHEQALSYAAVFESMAWIFNRLGIEDHVMGISSNVELADAGAFTYKFRSRPNIYIPLNQADSLARQMRQVLLRNEYPGRAMNALMAMLINYVTHEMTHYTLESSSYGWTHDEIFSRQQQTLMTRLLKEGPLELEKLWNKLKEKYPNPTFLNSTDYLKALVMDPADNG